MNVFPFSFVCFFCVFSLDFVKPLLVVFSHRESAIQFKTADGTMAFIRICAEEPWHADVYDFLELRKNHGKEEQRARCFCYGAYWQEMWCWCGGWKGMKRWHALGIVVAGLLRCHSFCEYWVSFWRNRTWRRTLDLINFYPWYRHQKWRRHFSWCVVGFVVSVVLEAPIFWKCQTKPLTHGVDPVLLILCRPGTCFLVFGSLISSWSVPRYWYFKPMPWDGDMGLTGVSCDHAGKWWQGICAILCPLSWYPLKSWYTWYTMTISVYTYTCLM